MQEIFPTKDDNIDIDENENKFSHELQGEIKQLFYKYFKENQTVPKTFEEFDKDISDIIIKILNDQDSEKKKNKNKSLKTHNVNTNFNTKKFIK